MWYSVPLVIVHQAVVAPLAHEPDHLVGVHVAFAEQREDHHAQRREPVDASSSRSWVVID